MKYFVILAFLAILASLGSALFFMLKNGASNKTRGQKMAFALAMRVAISILLFISILLGWKLGYLHPTGIDAGQ
jgi:hypothetical protein